MHDAGRPRRRKPSMTLFTSCPGLEVTVQQVILTCSYVISNLHLVLRAREMDIMSTKFSIGYKRQSTGNTFGSDYGDFYLPNNIY